MHPRNIGDFDFQEAKFNWISVLPPFHGVFSQCFSCILSPETLYAEGCNCWATRLSLYIGGNAGRAHSPSVLPHLSLLTWAALGLHLPSKALAYQSLLQAPFSRELRLGEAAYCLDGLQDPLQLNVHGEGRQSTPNISWGERITAIRSDTPKDIWQKLSVVIKDYSVSYYSFPVALITANASLLHFCLFQHLNGSDQMKCNKYGILITVRKIILLGNSL